MAVGLSGSATTGALSAPGVGSGLDVKTLISQLMAIEQRPLTLLATREAGYQARLTSLGTIKGALSSLQLASAALASASISQYSATSGDASMLTATAASNASAGNYNVTVTKLAQVQKLVAGGRADTTTAIGSGADTTLTFTLGTISSVLGPVNGTYSDATFAANAAKSPVSVVINSSNNTLGGIRDAINAADAGVTASIINDGGTSPYRLTITSNDTGVTNSLSISASGDAAIASLVAYDPQGAGVQNLTQTQAARNAEMSIDGVLITSASNTVTDAIQGVTLNLKKIHASPLTDSTTVSVQRDNNGLTAALGALVKAYNDANKTIAGATAKTAVFQGDTGVLGMQTQVRSILGGVQETGDAYTMFSQLGVSFQKDGSLAIDSAKLNVALTADPAAVATLTAAIGNAINTAATSLLGVSGPVSSKTDGINRSIRDIGSRRTDIEHRLELTQQRYQKQFSGLDTLLSSMNKTSAFLTQQLDSITNMLKNK
jgi:flagellar hook-associated protein 2